MTKTGIRKWPRMPGQCRTDYRPGQFLCPNCGKTMLHVLPGFDFDQIPDDDIGIWFNCPEDECGTRIRVQATVIEILEETKLSIGKLLDNVEVDLDQPLDPADD